MHIHSRALLNFEAILRAGSIREAARRLHLSSSALNRQLLELESQIGRPLFERLASGLKVTAEGEVLSRHVVTVMQDAQRMEGELCSLRGINQGTVDILTVESLTADFIPRVLQQMRQRFPAVNLTVRTTRSSNAALMVSKGQADVAICFLRHRAEGLYQIAAQQFDLGVATIPTHELAARKCVTFEECVAHPIVLPTEDLSIFEEIGPELGVYRDSLNVILRTGSFELMRRIALQGDGIALVNRFGIERELAEEKLVHIPLVNAVTRLGIYTRADRVLPHAVEAFTKLACAELERQTRPGEAATL